ncbi:elongation factor P [Candidatus Gottesmanbacteria bacterium RBG_13_37_7]|uniref:Elongation factor P n=1 Tax=Candidatus Gottesmanbacteria bacterium RBG_13_37_7 TaxID=1798369 RepID=A0A1F5YIV5_9BACT|nr:MAG: elongation factor P [Candidatus Gottesmanbacteria bacterium RBG_13_37_7]
MSKISVTQLQKGIFINFKNEPYQVTDFTFVNPGKGSAFVRTKLKNLKTAKVQEFTYKSGESVEEIPINIQEMQFLYLEGNMLIFMDKFTYEQYSLDKTMVGLFYQFMKTGETYQVLVHDNKAIGMRYPKKVKLKVVSAEEAVKGNTATGAKKIVELETGVKISTPLFIKRDDEIYIDPETGEYLERSK